jgi:hypothetical protein
MVRSLRIARSTEIERPKTGRFDTLSIRAASQSLSFQCASSRERLFAVLAFLLANDRSRFVLRRPCGQLDQMRLKSI